MLVTGKNSGELRLIRSLPTASDGSTDLKSPALGWELLKTDICPPVLASPPFPPEAQNLLPPLSGCQAFPSNWQTGTDSYQMLNFVRQENLHGELFLFGGYNTGVGGEGPDYLQLFRVNVDQYGNPGTTLLETIEEKQITSKPVNGHGDSAAMSAAAGMYVSPSGELLLYATEYENDGPFELLAGTLPGNRTVRFAEWRHREIVRPDSPTLKPSLEITDSFAVDEGSSVILAGQGRQPITKAWLQLFEDDGIGLGLSFNDDAWLLMDYADYDKDRFDRLDIFDIATETDFDDNAGSWRWFAPQGCNLRVNAGTISNPVRGSLLVGNGQVREKSDLDDEPAIDINGNNDGNMDDMISSIQIRRASNDLPLLCEDYYNAPIGVRWDFDNDGIFEISGQNPLFSAALLDGPGNAAINVRAQHPTDTTALGVSAPVGVNIRVRNVAPVIADFKITDGLGYIIGADVPFALPFLEYTAEGAFTDAGKPDRQTAVIDFGDGSVISNGGFDFYQDAFGGVTGRGRKKHVYNQTGNFTLRFDVADDDGGQISAAKNVTVASPSEILQWIVSEIDVKLAASPSGQFASQLRDARDAITGNNSGEAQNGALDHIGRGNLVAAMVKLIQAVSSLEQAEMQGAGNLTTLKFYICLAGQSLAQKAYLDAVAVYPAPAPSQRTKLDSIQAAISAGQTSVVNGQYTNGLEQFRYAVSQALSLQ